MAVGFRNAKGKVPRYFCAIEIWVKQQVATTQER
jgi:hypothetical protein